MNRSKQLYKSFKSIDMFSRPVQLLIKKDDGHKTAFGSLITMVIVGISAQLLYSSLIDLAGRSQPTTVTTEVYHPEPEPYQLTPNNFTLTFALQSPSFATYIDESVYIVVAKMAQKTTIIENGANKEVWESFDLPIRPCNEALIKQQALYGYFTHLNLQTNYCIDWNQIDSVLLQGTFDAPTFKYIHLQFKMCTEATRRIDGPACKSRDEVIQTLEQNYFSLQLSSNTLNLMNPDEPHNPKGEDLFTTTSSKLFKEISIYMQPLTTKSDYGLIQQDENIIKTLRYERHTEMIDLNTSDLIMNVNVRLGTTEQVNYRSYPKIQSILAQIGGLWQVLFAFALFIQKPFSNLSYKLQIINSLFNFEGQPQRQLKKSISTNIQEQVIMKQNTELNQFNKIIPNQLDFIQINSSPKQPRQNLSFNKEEPDILKVSSAISTQIRQYFQSVTQKIKLSWIEYLFFIKCFITQDKIKQKQIQYAGELMENKLDILYIIQKIQEIDKLKVILLNPPQRAIFDQLPKQTIDTDPYKQKYLKLHDPQVNAEQQNQNNAIAAFNSLLQDLNNPINQNLIQQIDDNMLNLIQIHVQQTNKERVSDSVDKSVMVNQIDQVCSNQYSMLIKKQ